MQETERLVRTWMTTGREEEVNATVSSISNGRSTLLNVVRALGEYLTNDEDVLREKGVDFLSQVLSRCPQDKINKQATRVLVNFYCSKLEDSETVVPAVKGFVPLTSLPTFTLSDATETVNALSRHLDMRSCVQSTRYNVFSTIDSLLANHREALRAMGDAFLKSYISLADGEKDPRNLMLVFSIDRVICVEFDISRHVEDLFNIISCYFPIAYTPPKDEPLGITSDDLRKALRLCINASPLFGQYAIPMFLEKLLAGSPATKRDILDTVKECIPAYGSRVTRNFAKKLWNSLKLEIFQPIDAETEGKALEAAKTVIKTIYEGTDQKNSVETIVGIAKDICEECLEVMKEPEKSQAIPGSKVIAALVGTTEIVAKFVLSQAISCLMTLFRDADEVAHRPQILTLLGIVTAAVGALPGTRPEESLQPYKDEVLAVFVSGIKETNSQEAAFNGLLALIRMPSLLSNEEVVYVVHNVNEVLQNDAGGEGSDEALELLIQISSINAEVIVDSTLPLLFSVLPDKAASRDAHVERARCWNTLRRLSRLCVSAPLFETLVIRLTTKLDLACNMTANTNDTCDPEATAAYVHAILKTLARTLEAKVTAKHVDVAKYVDRLLPSLYHLFIYLALVSGSSGNVPLDPRMLDVVAQIVTSIVGCVSVERQLILAQALHAAYFSGEVTALAKGHQQLPKGVTFAPFANTSPPSQKDLVILLSAAVIAFHKGILFPETEPSAFLLDLQTWYTESSDDGLQQNSVQRLVASLVNKNTEAILPYLSHQLEIVWVDTLSNESVSTRTRLAVVRLWQRIATALLVRDHPSSLQFIDRMFELFADSQIGWDAARAVGNCANGGKDVLTKRNHAVIRILFAQKYFSSILPRILESLQGPSQSPFQIANLVALTSLIASLPKSVYVREMPKLMPLLIRGLDLPDNDIRTNIFSTLLAVATSGGSDMVTSEHASTLVSVALKCGLMREGNSTDLRIAALKLLTAIPEIIRYDILHPLKSSVVHGLERALDDPKRAVRREAVDARTAWFMYKG